MGYTMSQKIIKKHLVSGKMSVGNDIGIHIDQTLTQDATGTMAYLEFESMGVNRVKTDRSVAYIDHNTLQTGFENADDHKFISSIAKKYGIYFSRPGNGICHQVHLERFAVPCKTLIGSDSHTPTCGGMGMLAIGAGGLDVAVAMAGGEYHISMPKMVKINLTGHLKPGVSAKDIILEVLRIMTVKGGVGKIIEYVGEGVKTLTVPERSTITNMGAELGATTSIFPSDKITKEFLKLQGRKNDFIALSPDSDAHYDETINIDLSKLVPMIACPHSPDNVKKVSDLEGLKIDQVCIGSCTNSSYLDLNKVAHILRGKTVNPDVSLTISPGSKQVLTMLTRKKILVDLIASGARLLECTCGPCIGMGQSPNSKGISLRTFNRNFEGRSGTKDAKIYLVSPETAAISAVKGFLYDPTKLKFDELKNIKEFCLSDNMIIKPVPKDQANGVKIFRGPNIKPFPKTSPLKENIKSKILLKTEDNITTDHIMPAGAKILPYRSNIPYLSKFCFSAVDKDFANRCIENKTGIIVGGANYGQGSSREHAALAPLYLGIKAVIAKSFARIHAANLVNAGILPLIFENEDDYKKISLLDELLLSNIIMSLKTHKNIQIKNISKNFDFNVKYDLSDRQTEIIIAGGLLNFTKYQNK